MRHFKDYHNDVLDIILCVHRFLASLDEDWEGLHTIIVAFLRKLPGVAFMLLNTDL